MILLSGANGYLGRHIVSQSVPGKLITTGRYIQPVHPEFEHFPSRNDQDIASLPWNKIRGVINVVSRVNGDDAILHDANVGFIAKLASAARLAGVTRFVHVSSFSVFGLAEIISTQSPIKPNTAYGRANLNCELSLTALRSSEFEPLSVRLPFMFDEGRPSFLGQVLGFCARFSVWPSTKAGFQRSMMTYHDAAKTLLYLLESHAKGEVAAAATDYFDYELLTRLIREEARRSLKIIDVPSPILLAMSKLAPSAHQRLFRSSILNPEYNIVSTVPDILGIEPALRKLIQQYYRCSKTQIQ